ncbi:MAG: tyrosine-type recombinase/integrase [Lachnospiraceae bacterium]|nr:tyrosine-type recombinase/integrase [Lachnospiraceae bacterium]
MGNDIIYLDGEETSKIERMIKEKYVEAHHSRDISFLENKNYWRTYTGTPRKEVTRRNREDLIDYLYKYYKARENETSSLQEVFNRSQGYRLNILNRSENTVERDRQVFERFYDKNFRMKPIGWFNDEYISRYINKRSKELNPKERALKDSLLILNRIFEYALKQEKIISYNPVQCVDIRNYYKKCDSTVKSSEKKIFTIEEIEAIKARIKAEMSGKQYDIIGYAMLFSIETGVRVAEIPPLRWSDITDKGIHIHAQQRMTRIKGKGRTFSELSYTKNERLHPKGGRFFPITDAIHDILDNVREMQAALGISSDFIFCDEAGYWLNKETYSQRLRRMCKRMGYDITNNHAFRMSLNSNVLIPLGIPVTERAYLLGHSVEINERYYSHMRIESLNSLKELLNQSIHARSRSNLIRFESKKIPQAL